MDQKSLLYSPKASTFKHCISKQINKNKSNKTKMKKKRNYSKLTPIQSYNFNLTQSDLSIILYCIRAYKSIYGARDNPLYLKATSLLHKIHENVKKQETV